MKQNSKIVFDNQVAKNWCKNWAKNWVKKFAKIAQNWAKNLAKKLGKIRQTNYNILLKRKKFLFTDKISLLNKCQIITHYR